jgi:hypothetical protein
VCDDDIASNSKREFKILLTAKKVLIKKVSHNIKNKVKIPKNTITKETNV